MICGNASAASYSLPADIGSGPFSSCSGAGPSYNCSANVSLNNNDSVALTADVTLNIGGDFDVGKNVVIDNNGFLLTVDITGDIDVDDGAQVNANLDADGKIELGKNVIVNGNMTAGDDVVIGDDTNITGNIDAAGKIDINKRVVISGDMTAIGEVKIGDDFNINGNISSNDKIDISKDAVIVGDLSALGDIKIGDDANITGNITSDGKIEIDKRAVITGDLNASDDIKIDQDIVINGDVTTIGDLDIGNNSVVNGVCTPFHPQCTGGPPGAGCETYRDEFSNVAYNNQDGSFNWSIPWNEVADDGLPESGSIRVNTNALRLEGGAQPATVLGGRYIEREADLSGYADATLTFNYRETGGWEANDSVEIHVSSDGGLTWNLIQTFTDDQGASFQPFSTDISAYISSNTRIAFVTRADNNGEKFFFDNIQIEVCTAATLLDHFRITPASAIASTCLPNAVTITAEDSGNNTLTNFTDLVNITVSTNHGNWSVNSADNVTSPNPDNDDDGAVSYRFLSSDAGQIVLDLTNIHAETLTIQVSDPFQGVASTSVAVTFGDNVLVLTEDPVQVAGRPQAMNLAMWTNDGSNCFINQDYNSATQSIEASIDRGGVLPAANDPAIGAVTIPDGPATATLTFDFSITPGQVDFNLDTSDVGQYRLTFVDITSNFSDQVIAGIGNLLTVRPFGISVTGIMAGATVNPGGNTPTDPIFTAAGNDFEATVAGVLWSAADDGNNDGVLDTGVFAGNAIAPSYAWDTTLSVSAAGFTPATGVPGVLNNGAILQAEFGGGSFNVVDLQYTEVGSFTLQSIALDFLGLPGLDIIGDDIIVGRFTPASLLISSTTDGAFVNTNINGLVPYTYIGQGFSYNPAARPSFVVTALNAAGSPTLNYTDVWAKLTAASISLNGPTADNIKLGSDAVTPMAITYTQDAADFTVNDLGGGRIEFIFTDDDFVYNKDSNSQVSPFNPEVDLIIADVTDADTITNTGTTTLTPDGSTVELRFGRLRMENAFGSELNDLIMNYHLEYYDVIGMTPFWTRHDDADTTIVAPGDINAVPGNTAATAINPSLVPGKFEITLSAPLVEVVETITNLVDGSGEPWLQYDWDSDGLFDNNPSALATFGIFDGDPVQIYIQQIYQ